MGARGIVRNAEFGVIEMEEKKAMKHPYTYGVNVYHEYPDITVTLERITPEIAADMLGVNIHNRTVHRNAYAQDMAEGNWMVNGATIVFSNDGILRDGQTRLLACVESEESFDTFVVRGVNPESQFTMDTGSPRTLSDMLKLEDYPNADTLAAITRQFAFYDRKGNLEEGLGKVSKSVFSMKQLLTYVHDNYASQNMHKITLLVNRVKKHRRPSGMWGLLIREFLKSGEENTEDFLAQVAKTKGTSDVVMKLLNKLEENEEAASSVSVHIIAAWIIKTWNAWMQGTEIKTLSFKRGGSRPERFPSIYVEDGE